MSAPFKKYPAARGTGVDISLINEAEQEIGLNFSLPYEYFLQEFGGGCVADLDVYGLSKADIMPTSLWSVVQNTNFYKNTQKWPGIEDWYIISDDGRGNPIGCKPDGSVWLSDHDCDFEQLKLADSFEEFLEKILEDRLYE